MKRSSLRYSAGILGIFAITTCVTHADSYTLSPGSPTLPGIPAAANDILYDVPGPALHSVGVPSVVLGLVVGDVIDAISDGADPVVVPHTDFFSVTPGSAGAPGSGVAAEVAADTAPGATPGHASDIFITSPILVGTNVLAPAGFGWTLGTTTGDEANTGLVNPGDNVNAYDLSFLVAPTIYFSLAPGSPTLLALGYAPGTGGADLFTVDGPDAGTLPDLFLPAAVLGLPIGADLDALALFLVGGAFAGPGTIEYSLTTATAGGLGFSGADILGLSGGGAPVVVHPFGSIGLLIGDDLDALDVSNQIIPEPSSLSFLAFGALMLVYRRPRH